MDRNIAEKFWVLKKGPNFPEGYNTRKQAMEDGALIMTYGYVNVLLVCWCLFIIGLQLSAFLDKILNFIGIGVTLYLVANLYGFFSHDSIIKHTMKCPYCKKEISQKVRRLA